jgi:hypothetical protein
MAKILDPDETVHGEQLADAVLETLRLHRADRGLEADPDNRCFECAEMSPCPTLRAVAGALGVLEEGG